MCYAKRARSMASNPLSSGMKASKMRGHRRVRPSYQGPLYFLCAAQSIGGFVSTARNAGSIITLSRV
jgi:hypothetical protein